MSDYIRANTDWLAACRYGLSVHWTADTMPLAGEPVGYQEAVERFDLDGFVKEVLRSGADYVIFTCTHAKQKLPCPNEALDKILPGRTCKRDLIGEMAQMLGRYDKHLILYYNHSCNQADDPQWEQAVGYHGADKDKFFANLCDIIGEMGRRYGRLVKGWWFDSSYSVDPRGPHNSVTTDLAGWQFPWQEYTKVAKAGYANRLVTYNAGIDCEFLYTDHQDYWAGEMVDLKYQPKGRYLSNGLQLHGWTCLDDRRWAHTQKDKSADGPLYEDAELAEFVKRFNATDAPVCFNCIIYQDGVISEPAVEQLERLRTML